MPWLEPITLSGPHAQLKPLAQDHCEGLTEAVKDGELWKLWYTLIPRTEDMSKEIDRRLGLQMAGSMLPWTVFDSGGRVAFKGATNVDRTFVTGNLPPGKYVVQFNAKSVAMNGNQYLVVVSAGRKKVIADAVAGEKFAAGGIAMRVEVGSGLKITGQVASGQTIVSSAGITVRIVDGKRYVWIGSDLGSNLGGHWEEEGMASAKNIKGISMADLRKIQDRSFEGSLLNRHGGVAHDVHVHGEGY